MDSIVQNTLTKNNGLVSGLQGKSKGNRKLNSYEQQIVEQNALWAEVAKQGGLGSKKNEEEEEQKLKQQLEAEQAATKEEAAKSLA